MPLVQTRPPVLSPAVSVHDNCGVLHGERPAGSYRHVRYAPPAELGEWVEHFWSERWAFPPGARELREMLPHPNVHLVFVSGAARIYGVQSGLFRRELTGVGRIFGVRFWPGVFRPFLGRPVCTLTNRCIAAVDVFADIEVIASAMAEVQDEATLVARAGRYLLEHRPPSDPRAQKARAIVQAIASDRSLTRVQQLLVSSGCSERELQRLFRRHVGASASWVIKRYRLYEALDQLRTKGETGLAQLAHELGYCDQAHFAKDFRKRAGESPRTYRSNHRRASRRGP